MGAGVGVGKLPVAWRREAGLTSSFSILPIQPSKKSNQAAVACAVAVAGSEVSRRVVSVMRRETSDKNAFSSVHWVCRRLATCAMKTEPG